MAANPPVPGNGERLNRISDRVHELELWRYRQVEPSMKLLEELVPIVKDMHEDQLVMREVKRMLEEREKRLEERDERRWSVWHTVAVIAGSLLGAAVLILQVVQTLS